MSNVHHKFQGCTVDVQAATGFQQSVPILVVGVQTFSLDDYTLCCVVNVHKKFRSCPVAVQTATGFSIIST